MMLALSTEVYGKHVDDLTPHEENRLMEIAAMKWLERDMIKDETGEGEEDE